MKNHENLKVFRGNIVSGITVDTLSDIEMLFGTFHMKNIFIDFPTPILNHDFCSISLKNSCFLKQTWWIMCEYSMLVHAKPMKIDEFFDEIEQKYG